MKKEKFLPMYMINYIAYYRVCLIFSWSTIRTEVLVGEFNTLNELLGSNESWLTKKRMSLEHCERVSIISIINCNTFITKKLF